MELLLYISNPASGISAGARRLLPNEVTEQQVDRFKTSLIEDITSQLGRPVKTDKAFNNIYNDRGRREAIIRGLAGGMSAQRLWKIAGKGGRITEAESVWTKTLDYGDPALLFRWVANQGSRGRRLHERGGVSQDVGDASKRIKTKTAPYLSQID